MRQEKLTDCELFGHRWKLENPMFHDSKGPLLANLYKDRFCLRCGYKDITYHKFMRPWINQRVSKINKLKNKNQPKKYLSLYWQC